MPYISQELRDALAQGRVPAGVGELNYQISSMIDEYLHRVGLDYAAINAAIGVLECAKMELYRRIASPYEDKKHSMNGEVYEYAARMMEP